MLAIFLLAGPLDCYLIMQVALQWLNAYGYRKAASADDRKHFPITRSPDRDSGPQCRSETVSRKHHHVDDVRPRCRAIFISGWLFRVLLEVFSALTNSVKGNDSGRTRVPAVRLLFGM